MAIRNESRRNIRQDRVLGKTDERVTRVERVRASSTASDAQISFGLRGGRPPSAPVGTTYFETDTGWLYYHTETGWSYLTGTYKGTDAQRGAIAPTSEDIGAEFYATDTNRWWRVSSAPAWVEMPLNLPASPDITGVYRVSGNQVVGARLAAVASVATADAGAAYDATAQTLINELKTQLNLVLSRLRTHGLIAT